MILARTAPARLGLLVLVAAGLAGAACGGREDESAEFAGETIAVTVQPARLDTMRDTVSVSGSVVPSTIADFLVTAAESCEIVELPKNEGDAVQAGDLLVRLDVPSITNEIATRQLELSEATTRYETAKANEARLNKLFSQGIVARLQWENARTALSTAENYLNQVRSRFDSAKALESNTIIRARFAGVVVKRWHAPGDLVAGGENDPIMRVIDPTRLQVALQVPADRAGRISQGQPAVVQTGTATEAAVVAMKEEPSGPADTTVDVRLNFVAPSKVALEAIVQAEIVLEERKDALVVPAGAIQRDESGAFVWLAADNSVATKRPVRPGLTANGLTQVVSGLAPGDLVIVTGIAQLAEGTPISIGRLPGE